MPTVIERINISVGTDGLDASLGAQVEQIQQVVTLIQGLIEDPPNDVGDFLDLAANLPLPEFMEEDLREEAALAEAGVNFQSKSRRIPPDAARLALAKYWAMIELIEHNLMFTLGAFGYAPAEDMGNALRDDPGQAKIAGALKDGMDTENLEP